MLRALFSLLRLSRQLNKERQRERTGQNCYTMLHVFFFSFLYFSTFNFIQRRGGIRGTSTVRFHSTALLRDGIPTAFTFFQKPSLYKSSGPITTKQHNKDAPGDGLTSNCVFTSTAELLLWSSLNRLFVPWSSQYANSCSCLKINRLFYGTVRYTSWSSHYSEGFC